MKRYILVIIVLALLTMLPSSPLAPHAADAATTPQQRVLELVNQHRANAGCQPLKMHASLKTAAQRHAGDMATKNFFSHTGSNGSSMVSRVDATGYPWVMLGENIAAGQSTPKAVVNAWMNSPSHRANILNCGFREIGIGYVYQASDAYPTANSSYRYYWVQDFGAR